MQEIKKFYQDFFFHSQSIGSRFFYQKSSFCLRAQGAKLGVIRQVPGTVERELKVGRWGARTTAYTLGDRALPKQALDDRPLLSLPN